MSKWSFNYVGTSNKALRSGLKMLVILTLVHLLVSMWRMPVFSETVRKWVKTVRDVQTYPYLRQTLSAPQQHVVCNILDILALNDSVVRVKDTPPSWASLVSNVTTNHPGGHYIPVSCDPQHRVAIVIPYRNRESQLLAFLQHMHPFLQRQMIEYRIFVIELVANITFNRALLMNIGFVEANKGGNFTCYIFHDVDLLPEDLRNLYICQDQPRHMSVAINKFNYRLPYTTLIGGACAFTEQQFRKVNGFSNMYFGWGGEDDDMYIRVKKRSMNVTRYPVNIARYKMVKHKQETPSILREKLLEDARTRIDVDGLNTLKYNVLHKRNESLYTWIMVSVNTRLYGHIVKKDTIIRKRPVKDTRTSANTRLHGLSAKNSNKSATYTVKGTKTSVNTKLNEQSAKNSNNSATNTLTGRKTSVNTRLYEHSAKNTLPKKPIKEAYKTVRERVKSPWWRV